ncbi:MAG: sugar nucleotide-binding protein [Nanoarchaeota archaeon]
MIVHAAANASVSWCEKNPEQAIAINQDGTRHVVDAANAVQSKVILISSFAIANTKTLYGRTKAASEKYVQEALAGYIILRPSLVIWFSPNTTNDRPFNRILRNITDHVPAVYDMSWKFQPTWLYHLNEILDCVLEKGITNETIHVSVPEIKTRYDLARDILEKFNISVTPEDKHDDSPAFLQNLSELDRLGLPKHSYAEMIAGIVQEIEVYLDRR